MNISVAVSAFNHAVAVCLVGWIIMLVINRMLRIEGKRRTEEAATWARPYEARLERHELAEKECVRYVTACLEVIKPYPTRTEGETDGE